MTPSPGPRVPPLPADERSEEQRRLLETVGSELNIFTTFARFPDLTAPFLQLAGRLLRGSGLPAADRETLILRTAFRCASGYEWVQHVRIAAAEGLSADVVAQLDQEQPQLADPHPVLLARAADELVLGHALEQDTWDALRRAYDEAQVFELCLLVGNYVMIAGALRSLQVPLEEGRTAPGWAR